MNARFVFLWYQCEAREVKFSSTQNFSHWLICKDLLAMVPFRAFSTKHWTHSRAFFPNLMSVKDRRETHTGASAGGELETKLQEEGLTTLVLINKAFLMKQCGWHPDTAMIPTLRCLIMIMIMMIMMIMTPTLMSPHSPASQTRFLRLMFRYMWCEVTRDVSDTLPRHRTAEA